MFYLVQRTDCAALNFARDIDPNYGKAFDRARVAGVEAIAYDTQIDKSGVVIGKPVPIVA
jgi:sugar fermentation stimulation protein A